MGETKDHKYCWNLFSGDRDHVKIGRASCRERV